MDGEGWRRELLKRFGAALLLSAILIGGVSYAVRLNTIARRERLIGEAEVHNVQMRKSSLSGAFRTAVSDILYLSELNEVRGYLSEPVDRVREGLTWEFISFVRRRMVYDQLRLLSEDGMELVRVDYAAGEAIAVPAARLQDKSDRYYVREALACAPGMVYVSPFDLNIEGGEVERPLKPLVRFAVYVPSGEGKDGGIIVLNLRGDELLRGFDRVRSSEGAVVSLLNSDGYWLQGADRSREWGFILPGREDERFGNLYPAEWARIGSSEAGQFETENGLFSYATVYPLQEVGEATCELTGLSDPQLDPPGGSYGWKIVSRLPAGIMAEARGAGLGSLLIFDGLAFLGVGVGAFFIVRRGIRNSRAGVELSEHNERLSSTLSHYLPDEITVRILADPSRHMGLGGEACHVSVLFADVRGFTGFAEEHDARTVMETLNRILPRLVDAVLRNGGILDKFLGDGLLAFFEVGETRADAARRAIAAAREMQVEFSRLVDDPRDDTLRRIGLGIGISSGEVIVGNVGSERMMDYTVIGDSVNVASRLQGIAKAGEILITEGTYNLLRDEIEAIRLPRRALKGRSEKVAIYRVGG